jgi:hypothetical protein
MNRQPLSLVERTMHRTAVDSQANGWINRPGKRRMRARRWEGRTVRGGKPVHALRCGPRRRRRSKPEGEASWEGSEREGSERVGSERVGSEGGVEDRKEWTVEGIGEQRALYTRTEGPSGERALAPSGRAKPEEAAHRQRFYTSNSSL